MLSKAASSSQVGTLLWSMRLALHTGIRMTLGLLPDLCFEALAWAAVKAPAGPAGGHSSPLAAPISLGPSPCTPTAHQAHCLLPRIDPFGFESWFWTQFGSVFEAPKI